MSGLYPGIDFEGRCADFSMILLSKRIDACPASDQRPADEATLHLCACNAQSRHGDPELRLT